MRSTGATNDHSEARIFDRSRSTILALDLRTTAGRLMRSANGRIESRILVAEVFTHGTRAGSGMDRIHVRGALASAAAWRRTRRAGVKHGTAGRPQVPHIDRRRADRPDHPGDVAMLLTTGSGDVMVFTAHALEQPMVATDKVFTGSIPEIYQRCLVPLIFEPYALDLAQRVAKAKPRNVLETAAGTGVVTRAIALVLPSTARMVVTDLNQAMLGVAQSGLSHDARIEWRQADALALPFWG